MTYMKLNDTLTRTMWHLDFRRAKELVDSIDDEEKGTPNERDKIKEFQLQEFLTVHHQGAFLQFRKRKDVFDV